VGEILCDALDKLATTDLPVWLTELDVSESDVDLRADDLEVVLREAYMWRKDACLINADGTVNDAGEWSVISSEYINQS
jgi:hypothetical protein